MLHLAERPLPSMVTLDAMSSVAPAGSSVTSYACAGAAENAAMLSIASATTRDVLSLSLCFDIGIPGGRGSGQPINDGWGAEAPHPECCLVLWVYASVTVCVALSVKVPAK